MLLVQVQVPGGTNTVSPFDARSKADLTSANEQLVAVTVAAGEVPGLHVSRRASAPSREPATCLPNRYRLV